MKLKADLTDEVTGYFLGRSKAIRGVYKIINRVAPTDCTVLLTGETGSGKGVIARLIHAYSHRKQYKFVSIDCRTLPEPLFESELFGHSRGSFTGAVCDKEGLFETADRGTIFMDDIPNAPPGIQAKLLEVLEGKVMRRVGETNTRTVNARLISASNQDLDREIKEGRFREDLYYRINAITIHIPPLRERRSDIPLLARYFIGRYCQEENRPVMGLTEEAGYALVEYPWRGNVRELGNAMRYAVIMSRRGSDLIGLNDLEEKFAQIYRKPKRTKKTKKYDRETLIAELKRNKGNVSATARSLGEHRKSIQRWMRSYQIKAPEQKVECESVPAE